MDNTTIALLFRGSERLLSAGAGAASIYLGWRLYQSGKQPPEDKGEGEITAGTQLRIVLKQVGPGVFFAALGAVVLYTSITQPTKIEPNQITMFGGGGSASGDQARCQAINTLEQLVNTDSSAVGTATASKLKKAIEILSQYRNGLAINNTSEDQYRLFRQNYSIYLDKPDRLDKSNQKIIEDLKPWLKDTVDAN